MSRFPSHLRDTSALCLLRLAAARHPPKFSSNSSVWAAGLKQALAAQPRGRGNRSRGNPTSPHGLRPNTQASRDQVRNFAVRRQT